MSIGATFYLFIIYFFHFIFAFSVLTFFCRLYRRQLLYCCPPRIVPLIVGNIDFNYLTIEYTVVVVVVVSVKKAKESNGQML